MLSHSTSPTPDPPALVEPPLPVHSAIVAAQLTHHITIPAQGAKGKPREKKEQKTKELKHSFTATPENYIDFLTAILAKHGEEKYNVTSKKRFSFKALCPPNKAYVFRHFIIYASVDRLAEKETLLILTISVTLSSLS